MVTFTVLFLPVSPRWESVQCEVRHCSNYLMLISPCSVTMAAAAEAQSRSGSIRPGGLGSTQLIQKLAQLAWYWWPPYSSLKLSVSELNAWCGKTIGEKCIKNMKATVHINSWLKQPMLSMYHKWTWHTINISKFWFNAVETTIYRTWKLELIPAAFGSDTYIHTLWTILSH